MSGGYHRIADLLDRLLANGDFHRQVRHLCTLLYTYWSSTAERIED